jgi:hypothetical protein
MKKLLKSISVAGYLRINAVVNVYSSKLKNPFVQVVSLLFIEIS